MRGVFKTRCADQEWIGCGSERGRRARDIEMLQCSAIALDHSLSDLKK